MSTPRSKNGESLQPLLSEVQESAGPLLGGASEIEQSPLERLIQQSTSEQAAAASASPFFIEDPDSSIPHPSTDAAAAEPPAASSIFHTTVITLGAGTLCLLQICLVWASFLSNVWFETHLTITVGSSGERQPHMQNFEFSTDQTLQKTTLANLLSMLLGADQEWPAMTLVMTCLICPCLCMVLCPSWTVGDYQEAIRPSPSRRRVAPHAELLGFDPRVFAEHFLVRICFLAFFLLAILDVGTSSLALENNHSEFLVTNKTRGGVICYTVGMACALGVVVLLRVSSQSPFQPPTTTLIAATPSSTSQYARQDRPRAPPDQAFRELQRPLLTDEDDTELVEGGVSQTQTSGAQTGDGVFTMTYWKRIVIYEFGILASVLWIPALFLPLFQITFRGFASSFIDEVSFEVPFYQLPTVLLLRGKAAGTDQWALLSLGVVLLLLVYILPLVATASAIAAWRSPDYSKAAWFLKAVLRCFQPCLCGFIFSLSLLMAVPTFEPLGDYLLDTRTSGFCERFENITDTSCLQIQGEHRIGQWFLLAQSIALEVFVILTVVWKR